jgi:predicted dehydrogenase
MPFQRVQILGTTGRIEIMIPFTPSPEHPCEVWHYSTDKSEKIVLELCNQYQIEVEQFAHSILNNTRVPVPLADALANMKVIDAIAHSARTAQWIEI